MIGPRIGPRVGERAGPSVSTAGLIVRRTWLLDKTGGVDGSYDAQAYTNESFSGTVSVQFAVAEGGVTAWAVGLSADNPSAHYNTIDFSLLNDTGTMFRNENGSLTSLGATAINDVWKVTRTMPGGAVTYYKNGALVSTSSNTSTAALIVDSSLRFAISTVKNLSVSTALGHELLTWATSNVTVTQE